MADTAQQQAQSQLPLFYKNPVLLDGQKHQTLSLKNIGENRFKRDVTSSFRILFLYSGSTVNNFWIKS